MRCVMYITHNKGRAAIATSSNKKLEQVEVGEGRNQLFDIQLGP